MKLPALSSFPAFVLLVILSSGLLRPGHAGEAPAMAPEITLRAIFQPPRLLGHRPSDPAVSPDGRYVVYRWVESDAEEPRTSTFLATTDGKASRRLAGPGEAARIQWSGQGSRLIVHADGWIESAEARELLEGGEPTRHFETGSRLHRITVLEGPHRVIVDCGEPRRLFLLDIETGRRLLLDRGVRDRASWQRVLESFGKLAVFARPGDSGEDSESPRRLCLLDLDGEAPPEFLDLPEGSGRLELAGDGSWGVVSESQITHRHELVMADYLGEKVRAVPVRNSLAGDRSPVRRLHLWRRGQTGLLELPLDGVDRFGLRGLRFSPGGQLALLERLDDLRQTRQICVIDPEELSITPVFTETDEAWIGGPFSWSAWGRDDGQILFTSERSGFNHLYRLDLATSRIQALTSGEFEVQEVRLDASRGRVLLRTNATDASIQQLDLLDLATGERRRLGPEDGCATSPRWSRDGTSVVYLQSFLGVPAELYALKVDVQRPPLRLTRTIPERLERLELPRPEMIEYSSSHDGTRVRAHLYRPRPHDPSRRYPLVVFVHGAGYLQNVTRSMTHYDVNLLFHHRLTRLGFAVLDPDYRHSAGYGRDFRTDVHGYLGGRDLDDVADGVRHVVSLGLVDPERVGIYGGSYGGFLTIQALIRYPEVFACGAALRSVTDWRTYNAWYTNPRLGSPDEHPENYRRSSPLDHAEHLGRPLLLLHGLRDDNVFAQDTIRLVEKLIQHEKPFDLMLYPSQKHGFTDPESWLDQYRRIESMMVEHLK